MRTGVRASASTQRCMHERWLLCSSILLLLVQHTWASLFKPLNLNTTGDWLSSIVAKGPEGCDLAPLRTNRPMPTIFSPNTSNPLQRTVDEIRELGWMVAPVVHMHPFEWSHIADPSLWMDNATILNAANLNRLTMQRRRSLLNSFRDLAVMGTTYFTSRLFPDLDVYSSQTIDTPTLMSRIQGDPLDARNMSTAKVWYTAQDIALSENSERWGYAPGTAVMFKFHFFYPFNGCSNQVFAVNLDSKYQGIEYFMCPPGIHEGDWEHMSLLVSVADWDDANPAQAIKRVQYSQHSWNAQYDCDLGECVFEPDSQGLRRLVAYSGLFTHAMYPTASPLHLYKKVSAELLMSIDGVYLGDRTARGGAVWAPTPANTPRLPFMEEMSQDQIVREYAWATYTGSWGFSGITTDHLSVTCFFDNFTRLGPCPPSNPAMGFLKYFVGLNLPVASPVGVPSGDITDSVFNMTWSATATLPVWIDSIAGPLLRSYTYEWENEGQAPLYEDDGLGSHNVSCPFSGDPTLTKSAPKGWDKPDVGRFLATIACLLVGAGLLFGVALCFPGLHRASDVMPLLLLARPWGGSCASSTLGEPPLRRQPSLQWHPPSPAVPPGSPRSPGLQRSRSMREEEESLVEEYQACRHMGWMLLALALYGAGVGLTVVGLQDVFKALRMVYSLPLYDTLYKLVAGVLILFGGWQVFVILVSLFVRNHRYLALWCVRMRNPFARWHRSTRVGLYLQIALCAVHVVAANTSMLLFAFGCTISIGRIAFQSACNTVLRKLFESTPAASLCLNFRTLGLDRVICGADLAGTCGRWQGLRIEYVSWGALLFLLSHMLHLSMSVHQYVQLVNLQACMDHLDIGLPASRKPRHAHVEPSDKSCSSVSPLSLCPSSDSVRHSTFELHSYAPSPPSQGAHVAPLVHMPVLDHVPLFTRALSSVPEPSTLTPALNPLAAPPLRRG